MNRILLEMEDGDIQEIARYWFISNQKYYICTHTYVQIYKRHAHACIDEYSSHQEAPNYVYKLRSPSPSTSLPGWRFSVPKKKHNNSNNVILFIKRNNNIRFNPTQSKYKTLTTSIF